MGQRDQDVGGFNGLDHKVILPRIVETHPSRTVHHRPDVCVSKLEEWPRTLGQFGCMAIESRNKIIQSGAKLGSCAQVAAYGNLFHVAAKGFKLGNASGNHSTATVPG